MNRYGECPICGADLEPVRFIEEERDIHNRNTGRVRDAVSHLECVVCGKRQIVDDSFDGPWYRKNNYN